MISLDLLKTRGITEESLQSKLTGGWPVNVDPAIGMVTQTDSPEQKTEKELVSRLIRRIRSRTQEGMTRNLADFRLYHALDLAWDMPFRQVTETLVAQFIDSDPNDEKVYKAFQDWGLTHLLESTPDPKDPNKKVFKLNIPTFFKVFVPLVQSYVKIRWAKIMNDRRLTPFFEYVPAKMTAATMAKCEAITDRVQVMSNQYGYYDVQKQAVLKMLHYGTCFQFVKEAWHCEEQIRTATDDDVTLGKKKADGSAVAVGDEIRVTDKEGLRYHMPHPSRTFYDVAHAPYTVNYDSGCEFMGYWRIERYRTIETGPFWNRDKIALGTVDLVSQNQLFFQSVYSSCQMRYPVAVAAPPTPSGEAGAMAFGAGGGTLDREKQLAQQFYGTEYGDHGVLITEYFEKLVPKDNGLGDYDCPVWFRFCVAGDGCTILYAEPLPYTPAVYYGYDADESRTKNAGMSLEILPFQDQFSNILTQIVLTAKQNLANMVFVDEEQVDEKMLKTVQNFGEKFYRVVNFFKYNSKKAAKYQTKPAEAFQAFKFPQGNTSELSTVLKSILEVLERVLVMSSNEVGQAASHEQTREEIRNIEANTSSRLVFTTTPVDIAAEAQKRQVYAGLMNYGDDDMYVHIPSDSILTKDILTQMGFTYMDKDVSGAKYAVSTSSRQYAKYHVKKQNVAISLWEFASTRDQQDRVNNDKIAVALAQLFGTVMNNPITAQAVGASQALEWANQIAYFAGLPRDFKLKSVAPEASPEDQQGAAQEQLNSVIQTVLQQVNNGLKQELQPLLQETSKNSSDIALIMKALNVAGDPRNDTTQPEAATGSTSQAPQPVA